MLSFRFGSGSGGSSRMPAAPEEEPKDSELDLSRGKDKSDVKKDDTTNSEAFYLYQKETNTLMKFFPELHGPERVVEVYSCSLNAGLSELQSQGSIYITGQYICFINTAGDIKEMIAFRDITDITKNATKMNTSIEISTAHAKLLFSFFLMRDKTLSMMTTIWKNRGKSNDQYTTLAASVKYAKENKTLHDLFPNLSTYETVLEHYSCSFGGNLQQGRMYITNFYCIYFYSSIPFIDDVKEQILFSQILAIEKISTSVIDNSIDIQTSEKRFSFKHFLTYRDESFSLLLSLWDKFKKRPRVFGTPLAELLLRENRGVSIPKFVEQAVTFLTASALNTEGLFRITPNLRDQEYLQFLIDDGEDVDFFSCEDKHQIAGLLKKYFRDLPQPLFTYEFHNCFLALYESKQLYDPSELMRRLRDLLRLLPHHNRQLARYMMEFLSKVAGHVANNKMNPKNLATIWGTIFLKASESEEVDVYFLKQVSEIMDLTLIMINNYDLLFAE